MARGQDAAVQPCKRAGLMSFASLNGQRHFEVGQTSAGRRQACGQAVGSAECQPTVCLSTALPPPCQAGHCSGPSVCGLHTSVHASTLIPHQHTGPRGDWKQRRCCAGRGAAVWEPQGLPLVCPLAFRLVTRTDRLPSDKDVHRACGQVKLQACAVSECWKSIRQSRMHAL